MRMFDDCMRLLLAAVAATVLLLSGCGGVENDPNLAAAAEKTEASGSSSFVLDVVQTDGAGGPLEVHCEGVADYTAKRMWLECGEYGTIVAIEDVYAWVVLSVAQHPARQAVGSFSDRGRRLTS